MKATVHALSLLLTFSLIACAPADEPPGEFASCLGDVSTSGALQALDRGDPSRAEQLLLELLNRSRQDPAAEATRFGIDLAEGTSPALQPGARAPLAMRRQLLEAARTHSEDMIERDYFDHYNPDGEDPFDRMSAAGYSFQAAGENIYLALSSVVLDPLAEAPGGHEALFVDAGYAGRGHRVNMVDSDFSEVGLGVATGPYVSGTGTWRAFFATQDFGHPLGDGRPRLLGVAYRDRDGDGEYDGDEALGGVTVRGQGTEITEMQSGSAGGFAFVVTEPGTFELEFVLEDGPRCLRVEVTDRSVKADLAISP